MAKIFDFPYRTVAEINLQAIVKNVVTLRGACRREIIPVLKANAYGHGAIPIAKVLLQRAGCEAIAVATLEEAIVLRNQFNRPFSILVLSGFLPHQVDAYYRHNLTPVVHSLAHLKALKGRVQLPPLHVKIDTGMNRLGIKPEEMNDVVQVIRSFPDKLAGLATHLASSEDANPAFMEEQVSLFEYWYRHLKQEKVLASNAKVHFANSGALIREKIAFATSVRPGISLYGVAPAQRKDHPLLLLPALQWKTRVLGLKWVEPGESVGYGRTFKADKRERIAILSVGYADGYPRLLSNRGQVIIRGQRADVCGIVSMDLCAAKVTDFDEIREGDQVTLLGRDGREEISATEMANWAQTISYEAFTSISERVQRVYFDSEAT